MRRNFVIGGLLASLALIPAGADAKKTPAHAYHIDISHTAIVFSINHMGFSTTYGRFKTFHTTSFSFDPAKPEKTKLELSIDTQSLDTGHEALDEHLRTPDFFDVAKFPTMTFKTNRIERLGPDTAKLDGELTLLGVTKPVTLDVKLNSHAASPFFKDVDVAGFDAHATIKRSEFGMTKYVPLVGDDVTIAISTEINNVPPQAAK